ncbi:unnamed protein product [Rotaria socialis]|uniref:Uncharacterized protein n=1 Tax=Rotaria socialis TaxID=392032 RepID=A0A817TZ13_9BILA|nr:unnamed protein product [Rotaria socialis]CAF3342477.1 unnamed protein product [Rotaria socialis]CAF3555316.1 unnamed protein product [Rotaria socialis]CAF4347911.1 unnamed protein product [Rotaria socialis]CAF4462774.1 unnamed protein product [Rotaria socialis]
MFHAARVAATPINSSSQQLFYRERSYTRRWRRFGAYGCGQECCCYLQIFGVLAIILAIGAAIAVPFLLITGASSSVTTLASTTSTGKISTTTATTASTTTSSSTTSTTSTTTSTSVTSTTSTSSEFFLDTISAQDTIVSIKQA